MAASKLKWQLLTKKRGSSTQGVPAGKELLAWVTNTVTLIRGERDAVLVDTFLSAQQSRELVDWVVERGKNLVTIYVTHAHGDHYFGLKILLDRFTNARAVATAPVVAAIQNQIRPDFVKSFWEPRFPGQLPSQLAAPEVLDGDDFHQWRRTDEADRTPARSRALRDTGTALLNSPHQRNSVAPDASPLARLDGRQSGERSWGVLPAVRSRARAASSSFESNARSAL